MSQLLYLAVIYYLVTYYYLDPKQNFFKYISCLYLSSKTALLSHSGSINAFQKWQMHRIELKVQVHTYIFCWNLDVCHSMLSSSSTIPKMYTTFVNICTTKGLYYVEETFFTKGQKSQEKAKKQAHTCAALK